jgi:hypothetical protein
MRLLIIVLSFFFTVIYFCFFSDQLSLACGVMVNDVEGIKKVKEIISQYPSVLNEDLDGNGNTPLIIASVYYCVSTVEFLLLCDDIEVNKGNEVC